MGFNLVGVALSEKFADKQALCSVLGLGEVSLIDDQAIFEDASSSYAMGDHDVYITEVGNGTLVTAGVLVPVADVMQATANGGRAMRFLLGENSGLYNFFYVENGKGKRSFDVDGDVIKDDRGKKLAAETEGKGASGVIIDLIGDITGLSFWDIEPEHPTVQYRKI